MRRRKDTRQTAEAALRVYALGYPESYEEFPWGERALKVRKKVFVFMGRDGEVLTLCVKLPESGQSALGFSFAQPAGYGLGKSGWVAVRFPPGEDVPIDLLKEWIDESFRAVAPKTVLAKLDAAPTIKPKGRAQSGPGGKK
jgi:predicted DNA-binding protein (MmcQ/YjbR family)